MKTSLGALSVLVEGKILGSRHRHANDNSISIACILIIFSTTLYLYFVHDLFNPSYVTNK